MGKGLVKVTLHSWIYKGHPIREKVMNKGNPTLITSRDKTNRKHSTMFPSLLWAIIVIFAFVRTLNMSIKGRTHKILLQVHTQ